MAKTAQELERFVRLTYFLEILFSLVSDHNFLFVVFLCIVSRSRNNGVIANCIQQEKAFVDFCLKEIEVSVHRVPPFANTALI